MAFAGAIEAAGVVEGELDEVPVNEVAKVVAVGEAEKMVPVVVALTGSTGESTLVVIDIADEVAVSSAEVALLVIVARGPPGQTVWSGSLKVSQAVVSDLLSLVGVLDGQYTENARMTEEVEPELVDVMPVFTA